MIGHNRLRMGTLYKYNLTYCKIEDERQIRSGELNQQPCAQQVRFVAALVSSNSSGLILPASGALV